MKEFRISNELPDELRPQVAEIYFNAFEGKIGGILKRDGTAQKFIASIMNPDHALFALSKDGKEVLGVAGFKTGDGSFTQGKFSDMAWHYGFFGALWRGTILSLLERKLQPGELQMDGIAVSENARGLGIGTALLNETFKEAEKRGLNAVSLDVIDSNPRAKALYERMGFETVGTEELGLFSMIFGFEKADKMIKQLEKL